MKHEYNFLHHTCLSRLNLLVLALMLFMAFDISAEELRTGNYTYSGGVTAGKQNGYGVCRYTNGTTYYGYWNMGYKEGLGRMVYADGTIEFGTWKHGKYVKPKGIKFMESTSQNTRRRSIGPNCRSKLMQAEKFRLERPEVRISSRFYLPL